MKNPPDLHTCRHFREGKVPEQCFSDVLGPRENGKETLFTPRTDTQGSVWEFLNEFYQNS